MSNERKLRLIQVAKEFKVGLNTITDFLQKKGIKTDGSPNTLVEPVNLRFRAELTQFCDLDTTSPFASSTSTGEIVTQTFSSKMNDEPVPALDQGFEGMRDSFDNNAPF